MNRSGAFFESIISLMFVFASLVGFMLWGVEIQKAFWKEESRWRNTDCQSDCELYSERP